MQTVLLKIMGNFMPFGKVDRFSVLIYFLMYALSMLNLFNFVCNFLNKYLHVKRERYKYLFSRYNLMLQLPSAALFPLPSLVLLGMVWKLFICRSRQRGEVGWKHSPFRRPGKNQDNLCKAENVFYENNHLKWCLQQILINFRSEEKIWCLADSHIMNGACKQWDPGASHRLYFLLNLHWCFKMQCDLDAFKVKNVNRATVKEQYDIQPDISS